MTAQIRPNRMEVSDRFPMLGFAVRTDQPDVEAEVVIASDIGLFSPQNRQSRTAANFYSSREHGTLTVPRGEGVFVVPPDVLARFIGNEKLFFGLATGRSGNGGLSVDALPRDGSPYVSLRGFSGRTLRRGFGGARASTPKLEWTGDAPKPGSEQASGSTAPASNGSGNGADQRSGASYDDGFGPMPAIPARESSYRPQASARGRGQVGIMMDAGTTADRAVAWLREKIEQGVQAAGSSVTPPSMIYLEGGSSTFTTAWQLVFGVTSLFSPVNAFLASIPSLAQRLDVTLSIGPALDTPLFGGGIGAVFAPDGSVALFGQGEISADLDGLTEFVKSLKLALAAKIKLGYNRGGLASFADISTVAGVMVGEEIVGGSEIWLDSHGSGIGGSVSIGVGFALQLAAQHGPVRSARLTSARQLGLPRDTTAIMMSGGTTARQALDWIMEKVEQVVGALGDTVSPPHLYRLGSDSGTFVSAWETVLGAAGWLPGGTVADFLSKLPGLARTTGVTLSVGPALDTPLFGGGVGVVFAPNGDVALFGQGEISVDVDGLTEFARSLKASLQAKLKLGYNRGGIDGFASMAKVGGVAVGEEIVVGAEIWLDGSGSGIGGAVSIGVGFALQLAADVQRPRALPFRTARQLGLPRDTTAITLGSGTTARQAADWIMHKVEQIVDLVGDEVTPPSLYRLGGNSSTFISAWETVLGAAGWLPGGAVASFLSEIPAASRATGVTLSIGPALDTPLFGGGVGVVFAPDGQVALFGQGDISVDFEGMSEFVSSLKASLQAKLKLGYNRDGLDGFASLSKVGGVSVGGEIVVGAEIWLNGSGSGIGGAVSVGVGFALQLAAQEAERSIVMPALPGDPRERARRIGGEFGPRIGEALDAGLDASSILPLLDKLDPPAKAVPLSLARPMSGGAWSVHWDDVYVVPQPTGKGCWATTIAMLMGWRDQMSYDPASVAQQCGRNIANGLPWAERDDVARTLGLGTVVPQCYTVEGFRNLIERHGPLYVGKIMSDTINSGHAVLATGMYYDGTDHYVRVADPWDRGAGAPGAPDPYSSTHSSGSQYIMKFDTFMHEYEMAAAGTPSYVQIIYAGIPAGRSINTSTAPPSGYAMAVGRPRQRLSTLQPRSRGMEAAGAVATIAGTAVTLIAGSSGGDIDWRLPQWTGYKHPNDTKPANEATYRTSVIELADGPVASGCYAHPKIRWSYNGTSIGPVYVERGHYNDVVGWGATTSGNIQDVPPPQARNDHAVLPGANWVAALDVVLTYDFQAPIGTDDPSATSRIRLFGDGTYDLTSEWDEHSGGMLDDYTEKDVAPRGRQPIDAI